MNGEKIRKTLIKSTIGLSFAPLESLQMAGFSGRMSKAGFHFHYQGSCCMTHARLYNFEGLLKTFLMLRESSGIILTCHVVGFYLNTVLKTFQRQNMKFEKFLCWYRKRQTVGKTHQLLPKTPPSMTILKVRRPLPPFLNRKMDG